VLPGTADVTRREHERSQLVPRRRLDAPMLYAIPETAEWVDSKSTQRGTRPPPSSPDIPSPERSDPRHRRGERRNPRGCCAGDGPLGKLELPSRLQLVLRHIKGQPVVAVLMSTVATTTAQMKPDQIRASKFMGSTVYDVQNQNIGSVKDLIFDATDASRRQWLYVGTFLEHGRQIHRRLFLPQAPTPMSGNVMYLEAHRVRPRHHNGSGYGDREAYRRRGLDRPFTMWT